MTKRIRQDDIDKKYTNTFICGIEEDNEEEEECSQCGTRGEDMGLKECGECGTNYICDDCYYYCSICDSSEFCLCLNCMMSSRYTRFWIFDDSSQHACNEHFEYHLYEADISVGKCSLCHKKDYNMFDKDDDDVLCIDCLTTETINGKSNQLKTQTFIQKRLDEIAKLKEQNHSSYN